MSKILYKLLILMVVAHLITATFAVLSYANQNRQAKEIDRLGVIIEQLSRGR